MKSIRNIAFSALLTIGAFTAITYTSCNKDECKDVVCNNGGSCDNGTCVCPTGYTGSSCDNEVRASYYNTYKGNGFDNEGDTYTNWGIRYYSVGTDAKTMGMELLTNTNAPVAAMNVTLTSNTTFTINSTVDGDITYTGSGTVSETTTSVTINAKDASTSVTLIFTFNNMVKQ